MPGYHGDIRLGDTIDVKFNTFDTDGAPITLAGTPAVAAYVGNGTTEITAGITLTVDFDSRTGCHNLRVVASGGNGFAAGTNVSLVITQGTVDGVSVVGAEIGSFSIENRSAFSVVGNGTYGNSALKSLIDTVDDYLDTEVAAILAAVDTEVAAIKAKTDNLPSDPADASDIASSFSTVNGTLSTISGLVAASAIRSAVGLASANLDTQLTAIDDYLDTEVAAILAAVDTEVAAIKAKTDNLPSDPADASDIASSFSTVNSTLSTISGLVAASAIRSAVGLASANLDTQLTAIDDYLDTEIAAILAAVDTEIASILSAVDTEVGAIKVVTDALGATAAGRLKLSAETMLPGTVDTAGFSPTTTEFEADDITEATADHFNGRIVIFTSGALQYQATDITDYALATGRGHFTVTALTEAPANDVTFIIV